jgi:hypothetical protein
VNPEVHFQLSCSVNSFLAKMATYRAGKPQGDGERDYLKQIGNELLDSQIEGAFTYRTADCCANPLTCLASCFAFPVVNNRNAKDLGIRPTGVNCSLIKTTYREKYRIPGLKSDDCCASYCICTYCCVIAQIRNELDEARKEKSKMSHITQHLNGGMQMERT